MHDKEIERWYRLRNLQKATQFLMVVAVGVMISGFLASRFLRNDRDDFVPPVDSAAGMLMENFSYSAPGAHPWKLEARSASISEGLDKVGLTGPQVTYLGKEGDDIILRAQTGQLDRTRRNFSAAGDVTIKYRDFLFTTSEIQYSEQESLASTDAPVSVKGPDLSLSGKGLRLWVKSREVSIENNVHAILYNVKLVRHGQKLPM